MGSRLVCLPACDPPSPSARCQACLALNHTDQGYVLLTTLCAGHTAIYRSGHGSIGSLTRPTPVPGRIKMITRRLDVHIDDMDPIGIMPNSRYAILLERVIS